MLRSLEQCVPKWAMDRICKRSCECGHKYQRSDVVQMGVRKVKKDNAFSEVLSVEVSCPQCRKGSVTTFSQKKSFRQFLCMLLSELQKIDRVETARLNEPTNMSTSKITDKEVDDFKIMLNKIKSHSELLDKLGIDTEEEEPDDNR